MFSPGSECRRSREVSFCMPSAQPTHRSCSCLRQRTVVVVRAHQIQASRDDDESTFSRERPRCWLERKGGFLLWEVGARGPSGGRVCGLFGSCRVLLQRKMFFLVYVRSNGPNYRKHDRAEKIRIPPFTIVTDSAHIRVYNHSYLVLV